MVIKGYISELPEPGDNHFQVRIPFIEDNTGLEIIMNALLCSQPGNYGGYDIGDCVFVSFEGDKHMEDEPITDVPVIMGKLYLDGIEEVHNNCVLESLTVTDNASLPSSTKFGTHSASELFDLTQNVNYLNNNVYELKEEVEKLIEASESGIPAAIYLYVDNKLTEVKSLFQDKLDELDHKIEELPTEDEVKTLIKKETDPINNNITSIDEEIDNLVDEQVAIESSVNTLQGSVGTLQSDVSTLQTNIGTLQQKTSLITVSDGKITIDGDVDITGDIEVEGAIYNESKQNRLVAGSNITLFNVPISGTNKFDVVTDISSTTGVIPAHNVNLYTNCWYQGVTYNGYITKTQISDVSINNNRVSFATASPESYGLGRFLFLKKNTTYTISFACDDGRGRVAINKYLKNSGTSTYKFNSYLKTPQASAVTFTTTSEDDVLYGFIFYGITSNVVCTYYNIQIEEGSQPTSYVPYTAINGTEISAVVPSISMDLTSIDGYDASKTQVLRNQNGVFQWVDV